MENKMKSTYVMNNKEYDFNFVTSLAASQVCTFVNFVTSSIVVENYYSHLRDIVFDFAIIKFMTDIDTKDIEDDIDKIESFLDNSNAVSIVKGNCSDEFIERINNAVDDNIQYRTGVSSRAVEKSMKKMIDKIINQVDSVDIKQIEGFAKAFSENANGITPESIVDAYIGSDTFKEVHKEEK